MARETYTRLIDDIDGSEGSETVSFALDGQAYEIDLSDKNAAKLRAALADYTRNGTKIGKAAKSATRGGNVRPMPTAQERELRQRQREWLRANGWTVADRGRLSAELLAAYDSQAPGPNAKPAKKAAKAAKVAPAAAFQTA